MAITKEEWNLISKRLEHWNEKLIIATFREGIKLNKDEMIEHVKAEDDLGKELAEIQMNYLRSLKERKW